MRRGSVHTLCPGTSTVIKTPTGRSFFPSFLAAQHLATHAHTHLFPAPSLHFLLRDYYAIAGFDALQEHKGEKGACIQP